MPTKTDRILNYLPGTFRALPRPTALYSVVDAFGNELLQAENSLAALMAAHWVDHADRGAELIDDLARMAALYGLAPRPDESVDEFREHLKRYIRIFLEGPSTVQGILRITAEVLGLRIDEDYAAMDIWWTQRGPAPLVTIEPRGEDAARLLFGVSAWVATGEAAQPARISGSPDLSGGAALAGASTLRVAVAGGAPVDIDLTAHGAILGEITRAINDESGSPIASDDGRFLTLASPTTGPESRLDIGEPAGDAAPRLLGLLPRIYRGAPATAAEVIGVPLDGPVDLTEGRYLRLLLDRTHLVEIDCGGADPGSRSLDQIRDAINDAFGLTVASHDGHRLRLTSPTVGFGSSIAFQPAAAQDARERLFGGIATFHTGRNAHPAAVTSAVDLSGGIDLSTRFKVRVRFDNRPPTTVGCAGADPSSTLLSEIVAALNAVLGKGVASHDGRFVRLASSTVGPESMITFEAPPPEEDATSLIFGVGTRSFRGTPPVAARVVGTPDLSKHTDPAGEEADGVDLGALNVLGVRMDDGPLVEVNVAGFADDARTARLQEIGRAIDDALGAQVASEDGQHLILTSPTAGDGSRIAIEPLTTKRRRRFVTRAFTSNEAAKAAFGFPSREARGIAGTKARVVGEPDLSRGVDLRETRLLRLAIDGRPAVEIDCAGQRPRATLLGEIVERINGDLGDSGIASSSDGRKLVLTSPSSGSGGRIAFEPPHAALDVLLGVDPGSYRGRDATSVRFVGTVDLSEGIDLSAASQIKISIDGEEHEIDCSNPNDPTHTTLNGIIIAINQAFEGKQVVLSDGAHVILRSLTQGEDSRIEFAAPSDADATKLIFGIAPPRSYRGAAALPAEVIGKDLSGGADVSAKRVFGIAVNGGEPINVDWTDGAEPGAHRTLGQIVDAINASFEAAQAPAVAKEEASRLVLSTTTSGGTARLGLLPYSAGDARLKLLGAVPDVTTGEDPTPAIIEGKADLLTPIDLSERRMIRVSIDHGRPIDIDIAGAAPSSTFLDEIVEKINAAAPGLASATETDHLLLTSPTRGESSYLALIPVRALELVDYPPISSADPPDGTLRSVRSADHWRVTNDGAADGELQVEIKAPHGVVGPQLVNFALRQRVRIMCVLRPGERLKIWGDPEQGLLATVFAIDGTSKTLPASSIVTGNLSGGATESRTGRVLTLPRGRSDWSYLDCYGARFNSCRFDHARFAGGRCEVRGVFNVSRFGVDATAKEAAVFSAEPPFSDWPVEVRFQWPLHQAGAFVVNLPADLPQRFGGKFNEARFARAGENPEEGERFEGVVTEPPDDGDYVMTRVNDGSTLVTAALVARVPLGYVAVTMPFRKPRALTLGKETQPARIYLAEEDVPGFIELSARQPGAWGNDIRVVARKAGPARFDVTISFPGARFENARRIVTSGEPGTEHLPTVAEEILKPGPVGIFHAKAAGVKASVTRDRAESIYSENQTAKTQKKEGE